MKPCWVLAAKTANNSLGCVNRGRSRGWRGWLYPSTQYLLDDIWITESSAGSPNTRQTEKWEGGSSRGTTKMVGTGALVLYGKPGGAGLVQSGAEMALREPNSYPPCVGGGHWGDEARLFTVVQGGRLTNNEHKVKEGRVRLDLGRHFFPMRTVCQWHGLPKEVVQPLSSEVFKSQLDETPSSLVGPHSQPACEQEVGPENPELPPCLNHLVILWSSKNCG